MKHQFGLSQPAEHPSTATRRSLFAQAAKLTGAGALAVATTLPAIAGGSSLAVASEIARNDIEILERLVAWELEMGAIFGTALAKFTSDDASAGDRLLPTQPTLTRIWFHDRAHLALLEERLAAAGGTAQQQVSPDKPGQLENFAAFLWTAAELKNASVAAYVESVASLETPALRKLVAGILAVEARHAAYLNTRNDEPAFTTETEGLRSPAAMLMDDGRFAPADLTTNP
jgi:hypothetical protein